MWTKRLPIFLALLCFASCLSPSFAQETQVYAATSDSSKVNWQTLDQLLQQLDSEATTLADNSKALEVKLAQALINLKNLQGWLEASVTAQNELKSSLALSEASLKASAQSLKEVQAQTAALNRSRNAWKLACIVVGAAGIGGTVYFILH